MSTAIKYMIGGVIVLTYFQPAQAAVVNLTGMHQQHVSKSCPAFAASCILIFGKIPAGKQIRIRRISCDSPSGSLSEFIFETTTSIVSYGSDSTSSTKEPTSRLGPTPGGRSEKICWSLRETGPQPKNAKTKQPIGEEFSWPQS